MNYERYEAKAIKEICNEKQEEIDALQAQYEDVAMKIGRLKAYMDLYDAMGTNKNEEYGTMSHELDKTIEAHKKITEENKNKIEQLQKEIVALTKIFKEL